MSQISTLKIRLQRKITIEITIIERSEQRRERERGEEKKRGRKKSPSITHVRALKTWKTARLITLLHSPSCLRLYARQSGEKERGSRTNNAAPQTYPPFLAFYSTLPPLLRLSSHSRDEERIRSATLFATASRGGPLYTMLNYEDGNFDLILSNYD